MKLGDKSVAVLLEVIDYDFANGLAKAKSRTVPDLTFEVPIADAFAMCLNTKPGQVVTLLDRRKAEILLATRQWSLVRPVGEEIPIVIETCWINFADQETEAA